MSKAIKVGILGTGRIGKIHIKNLFNHPQVEIKAVAEPFVDKDFVSSFGLKVYENAESVINDKAIDAIFICTPSDTHYQFIKDSINCGKAVFCEKPVDLDLNRILEIKELVKAKSGFLQVGFNRRFDANFEKIASLVSSGAVGRLLQVRITSRDFKAPPRTYVEASGGMFLDMSIHDFDMLRYLTKSEVKEVFVNAKSLVSDYGDIDIDTAIINLVLDNDCLAIIENCREAVYGYDQRVEVFGNKGRVFCENKYDNSVTLCNETNQNRENPLDFFLERYIDSYKKELDAFVLSLSKGQEPCVGICESIQSTLIAIAASESVKTKAVVTLESIKKQYNL